MEELINSECHYPLLFFEMDCFQCHSAVFSMWFDLTHNSNTWHFVIWITYLLSAAFLWFYYACTVKVVLKGTLILYVYKCLYSTSSWLSFGTPCLMMSVSTLFIGFDVVSCMRINLSSHLTLYSRTSNTNLKKAWQLIALIHSSNSY